MDANGYDPDSPTLAYGDAPNGGAISNGGRDAPTVSAAAHGVARTQQDTADADGAKEFDQGRCLPSPPLSEIVETLFSGTTTEEDAHQSTIDTVPNDSEVTRDYPGAEIGDRETLGADSQEKTARSLGSTLKSSEESAKSAIPASATPLIPGFTIGEQIGKGGMGIVYKAEQNHLKKMVALKRIRDELCDNPLHVKRFLKEGRAAARLNHANIVKVFHCGKIDGRPFLVLELLEGGTLADRLDGKPQPIRAAASLAATLARAVQEAHFVGLIHRDLKPSNVLFHTDGNPKIADFGLAKQLEADDGETRVGQVIGTAAYMSPEQAKGWDEGIGNGTDIYSLGVILYEMLTGRPPIKGANYDETRKLVQEKEPDPPSKVRPEIPYDLETICLKCLQKDPKKRYLTALEFAEDLDRFLQGKPVLARRTPLWERGVKLARRRPLATASAVLGICATVGAAWAGFSAREAALEAARQKVERDARQHLSTSLEANKVLNEAKDLLYENRWTAVQLALGKLPKEIKSDPRLAREKTEADELGRKAEQGEKAEQAAIAAVQAKAEAQARHRRFLEARDVAFFRDTRFDGRTEKEAAKSVAQAARDGLAIFGKRSTPSGDDWSAPVIPDSLTKLERDEISVGYYELLLILADAVAKLPGADPAKRADEAMAILDRAAAIRPQTRAEHLHRAAYLDLKGDRDGADQARKTAETVPPADAFDFFLIGRELFRRREWASAIDYLERASRHRPDHFRTACLLAISYLQVGQPKIARAALNVCFQKKPDSVQLYLLRGLASAREAAMKNPSTSPDISRLFDDAEADYRKAFELLGDKVKPDDTWLRYNLLHNRGLIRLERGDLNSATADFQEAIRLDDQRFESYSGLAEVARRQGKADEALAYYTRAIEIRPNYAPLYRARAGVLLSIEKLSPDQIEEALRDLGDSIRHETPGTAAMVVDRTNQALLLQRAGRLDEALQACRLALAIAPKYAPAHLIQIELLLALKRYEQLLRSCDAAIAAAAGNDEILSQLHELRGMAKDVNKDFAGAVADYTLALERRPKEAQLFRRRGWSSLANESDRAAARDFEEAIRLAPKNADAYTGLSFTQARLGQYQVAVNSAEAAIRLDQTNWRIAYKAARAYAQAIATIRKESRRADDETVRLHNSYRDRAVELLREAIKRASADQRADVRETIMADPVLQLLGRRILALKSVM